MQCTIHIRMDNAAFEESASAELARILRHMADSVVMRDVNAMVASGHDAVTYAYDVNGNAIGSIRVSP